MSIKHFYYETFTLFMKHGTLFGHHGQLLVHRESNKKAIMTKQYIKLQSKCTIKEKCYIKKSFASLLGFSLSFHYNGGHQCSQQTCSADVR